MSIRSGPGWAYRPAAYCPPPLYRAPVAYCPPVRRVVYAPPAVWCPPAVVYSPPIYVRPPTTTYVLSTPVVSLAEPDVIAVEQPGYTLTRAAVPATVMGDSSRAVSRPIIMASGSASSSRVDEPQTISMSSAPGSAVFHAPESQGSDRDHGSAAIDVIPDGLGISAVRAGPDRVVVSVSGINPRGGYATAIEIEGHRSAVPVLRLRNTPPSGVIERSDARAVSVSVTVKVPSAAGVLTLRVADVEYQVAISDAPQLGF